MATSWADWAARAVDAASARLRAHNRSPWERWIRNATSGGRELRRANCMDDPVTRQGLREKLEAQGYRCALTGRELTPATAAADHIVPLAKGGDHSLGNIQVLHKDVNFSKNLHDNNQFRALCEEVLAHYKKARKKGKKK